MHYIIKVNAAQPYLNGRLQECKMATGWNAPQGVENVHTLCAGKPESDDRGNNISVKRLGTSLDRCIERYIKNRIIIIIIIIIRLPQLLLPCHFIPINIYVTCIQAI